MILLRLNSAFVSLIYENDALIQLITFKIPIESTLLLLSLHESLTASHGNVFHYLFFV